MHQEKVRLTIHQTAEEPSDLKDETLVFHDLSASLLPWLGTYPNITGSSLRSIVKTTKSCATWPLPPLTTISGIRQDHGLPLPPRST